MPKSLVTGGAGFIGSHLVDELLQKGHQVVVLDDLSGGFESNIPNEALFVKGSILDHHLIDELFEEHQFDYVYHLAAYAAEGLSHFIKRFNYSNNVIGSVNLINAAVKYEVKCFVFTSSIAVYGAQELPMHEEMTPRPEDSYGIAKWTIEQELRVSHELFGLDYVIFRPHNVYGSRQNIGDRYRNVIGIFMNQLMSGEPLTIFGDGTQTRAFSHVSDIVPLIAESINIKEALGQTFDIGADLQIAVKVLADLVMDAMDIRSDIVFAEARNEVLHAYASHNKAKTVLGLEQSMTIREGLREMAEWAKNEGPQLSKKFEEIELEKNLPSSWK